MSYNEKVLTAEKILTKMNREKDTVLFANLLKMSEGSVQKVSMALDARHTKKITAANP